MTDCLYVATNQIASSLPTALRRRISAQRGIVTDIILATLNAKYAHCAFGLRYLMANLGELRPRARLLEFDINQRVVDMAEAILCHEPKIVGIGVYIWNA